MEPTLPGSWTSSSITQASGAVGNAVGWGVLTAAMMPVGVDTDDNCRNSESLRINGAGTVGDASNAAISMSST
jgi:hypothetical protein